MYQNQILEARALATVVPHNITVVDKSPWIQIQYVPSLGTGGAAATVAMAAGRDTMTFQVDAADPAGADSIGNTSGEVIVSGGDLNTMGEVVDHINGKSAWRAYLIGCLRSENPDNLLVRTAASAFGDNGVTLYSDSSVSKEISIAISGERFVNNGRAGHLKDFEDGCENSLMYAAITVTCASALALRYYTGKQGSAEVQVGQDIALTTATLKEQGEAAFADIFVKSRRGERLIVRAIGTESVALTVPTVHVISKTAVLANDRVVTAINYT